jgi:hypothetical protein
MFHVEQASADLPLRTPETAPETTPDVPLGTPSGPSRR